MIASICCLQDCTLRADSGPCICIYKRKPKQEISGSAYLAVPLISSISCSENRTAFTNCGPCVRIGKNNLI